MEVVANGVLAPEQTGPYSEQDMQTLQEGEQQEQQEELIGGKFRSADDLLQAYQELKRSSVTVRATNKLKRIKTTLLKKRKQNLLSFLRKKSLSSWTASGVKRISTLFKLGLRTR